MTFDLPLTYLDGKSIRNEVIVYSGNKNIPPYSFITETSYKALSDGDDGTDTVVYEAIERRHVDSVNDVPTSGDEIIQKRLAVFFHNLITGEYIIDHSSLIGGNGYSSLLTSPTTAVSKKYRNNTAGRQNNHIAVAKGEIFDTLVDHDHMARHANQRNNNFH